MLKRLEVLMQTINNKSGQLIFFYLVINLYYFLERKNHKNEQRQVSFPAS